MKRKILALFFGILWSLLLVPSVFAMDTDVDPSIRIYDYADLLTDEEEEALSLLTTMKGLLPWSMPTISSITTAFLPPVF